MKRLTLALLGLGMVLGLTTLQAGAAFAKGPPAGSTGAPTITVDKTCSVSTANVGDTVAFTIVITNTSKGAVFIQSVVDELTNASGTGGGTLTPKTKLFHQSESATYTDFSYTVVAADAGKTITNTATAWASRGKSGNGPSTGQISDSCSFSVPPAKLATTGFDPMPFMGFALLVLMAGGGLAIALRRAQA
jgi:hypothetical protein